MIGNYFKMAWRNLIRNKVSSIINIGGLSVGLATGIIIILVILNELSFDRFHKNLDSICLLMKTHDLNGNMSTGPATPGPLAASIRQEIPEIRHVARFSDQGNQPIKAAEKILDEQCAFADPDFFNMMTFPALKGNAATALSSPGQTVITESGAMRLFGNTDVLGKTIIYNNVYPLRISAIIKDVPENSTLQFDIVLPFSLYEKDNDWLKKWDDNRIDTWVQLKPGTTVASLNPKLKALFLAKQDEKNIFLFAYPFARLRLHDHFKNGQPSGGIIDIVRLLAIIAGFVLLIACINFMNLATARSERRAREVGMRKVLGATRRVIIIQFLGEALLMSLFATILGIILANIALPGFKQMSGKTFTPDFSNPLLWILLATVWLVTGFVAGSYPALYLSKFLPVKVLKKLVSPDGRNGWLRKMLVTVQFFVSIFLIIGTIVIARQISYMEDKPVGYDLNNLIDIRAKGQLVSKFDLVRDQLAQIPGVIAVTGGTDNLIGFGGAFNGLEWPGKTAGEDFYITSTGVQYNWITTAGIKLKEGRDFSAAFGADSMACLINESAVNKMHLKYPIIGTRLGNNTIIGVFNDFVFNDPSHHSKPLIVYLNRAHVDHFLVRIANNGSWKKSVGSMEQLFKKINPEFPFDFRFTRQQYESNFEQIRAVAQMGETFGGMAIFISCMGLFGLSAFLAERRKKELGIRKVLGSTVSGLWFYLSKDFIKPVLIAFLIAAPVAALVMDKVLAQMDYHISLSWWMFALAGILALLIALITVSVNGIKAAMANPAASLAAE